MDQVDYDYSSLGVYVFEFSNHTFLLHRREYDPAWEALNGKGMFSLKKFKTDLWPTSCISYWKKETL